MSERPPFTEHQLNEELSGGFILVIICTIVLTLLAALGALTLLVICAVGAIQAVIILIMCVRYIMWYAEGEQE